jgi:glycosyltransferase involved in cell wall biosynthesis
MTSKTDTWLVAPPPGHGLADRPPPTVTVIIPAYQASATIAEALRSVFQQTVQPEQIVVCDDGSTDDLAGAIAPFMDRVQLVAQANRGLAAARNRAAEEASGEFLLWLDADDYWAPQMVDKIKRAVVARPDLDLISLHGYTVTNGQVIGLFQPQLRQEFLVDQRGALLRGNGLYLPACRAACFRACGGFDEGLRYMEDWDCWLRIVLAGGVAGFLREPLLYYRRDSVGLSSHGIEMRSATITITKKLLARSDLSDAERSIVHGMQERASRKLASEIAVRDAIRALRNRSPKARSLALKAAMFSGIGTKLRARLMLAAAAPKIAGRRISGHFDA